MNPHPESEAIRTDIETTRRRMDNTVDQIGDRLQGRHLVDEVIGLFRRNTDNPRVRRARETISRSASNSMHAVVDTVKENPVPALLIGAGIAWMIYEGTRDKSGRGASPKNESAYDPDLHYDRPLEYPPSLRKAGESQFSEMKDTVGEWGDAAKEKAADWKDTAEEKLSEVGDKVSSLRERAGEKWDAAKEAAAQKLQSAKERAGEIGTQMKEGAQRTYVRTRDTVVRTADEHPLELGLGCLAAGLVAGLLIPTPDPVNRLAGPTADRLRDRTRAAGREMMDKGKRVARAAADAAREEADAQGLTPEHLRDQATAVAERAKEATTEAAQREGLTPGEGVHENGGASPTDPTLARPDM